MILSDLSFFEDAHEMPGIFGSGYGAVAISSNGDAGYSWNYATLAGAEYRALRECGYYANDCHVDFWFYSASSVSGYTV